MKVKRYLFFILTFACMAAQGFCFNEAGKRYGISPNLLKAVAITESSLRADIESPTNDIGLMGINRSWLPKLQKEFGITEQDVWNPCMNVHIGAWILAHGFKQHGRNWKAVGAYNAACTRLKGEACTEARNRYSRKIWQNWQKLSMAQQSS